MTFSTSIKTPVNKLTKPRQGERPQVVNSKMSTPGSSIPLPAPTEAPTSGAIRITVTNPEGVETALEEIVLEKGGRDMKGKGKGGVNGRVKS